MLRWHRDFSTKARIKLNPFYYVVCWFCWVKEALTIIVKKWIVAVVDQMKRPAAT